MKREIYKSININGKWAVPLNVNTKNIRIIQWAQLYINFESYTSRFQIYDVEKTSQQSKTLATVVHS